MSVIKEIRLKSLTIVSRLSRSLTVIGIDRYRSVTMTSYQRSIVTVGLSRTVSEINGVFSRKSQIFLTPKYFVPCSALGIGAQGQKNYSDGATGPRKKFDDIFSRLDTIHERGRHRWTDTR